MLQLFFIAKAAAAIIIALHFEMSAFAMANALLVAVLCLLPAVAITFEGYKR